MKMKKSYIKKGKVCRSRCAKKRSFTTEEDALETMKFLKICKEYKKLKRAYVCERCGQYHLTSQVDKFKDYGLTNDL